MAGPYTAIVYTADVPGAGTDEDVQLIFFGQTIFIGRRTLSGAGDALEKGHDGHHHFADEYDGIHLNGSLLDAVSCGIRLSTLGTGNPDWYCLKLLIFGGDLGDPIQPDSQVAIIEVNDWIRYGDEYVYFPVRIDSVHARHLWSVLSLVGPGRRQATPEVCSPPDEVDNPADVIRKKHHPTH